MSNDPAITSFATATAGAAVAESASPGATAELARASSSSSSSSSASSIPSSAVKPRAVGGSRRRWAALLTPIILIAGAVGGHRLWVWQSERNFERFVADIRRAGEPVEAAEVFPAPPADADNGAVE